MGVLHIQQIKTGMELARDIVGFNGATLLKKGSVLTDRHLNAFAMWGITEADIVGVDNNGLEETPQDGVDPETAHKIASELDRLFKQTDPEDPITTELYRIRKRSKLKALLHEQAS